MREPCKFLLTEIGIFTYIFVYLAASDLSCDLQNLQSWSWHAGSLVATCQLLVAVFGLSLPSQGVNTGPLHWEPRVLATGPAGKSLDGLLSRRAVALVPPLSI